MALLPLAVSSSAGLAVHMSTHDQKTPRISWARRAVRAVADFMEEWNYAQRRVIELRLFGRDGNHAPDTYGEFLARSPMALVREPAAKRRLSGACPRR
jgi:hypothetical protein